MHCIALYVGKIDLPPLFDVFALYDWKSHRPALLIVGEVEVLVFSFNFLFRFYNLFSFIPVLTSLVRLRQGDLNLDRPRFEGGKVVAGLLPHLGQTNTNTRIKQIQIHVIDQYKYVLYKYNVEIQMGNEGVAQ